MSLSLSDLRASAALVHRTVAPTAQVCWPLLGERLGCEVWIKHENHAPTGAFKVRGGLVYLHDLVRAAPGTATVLAATRGNHGQSVAFAARAHGISSRIFVPEGNSEEKNLAMRAFGARLEVHGRDFTSCYAHAKDVAREEGLHIIPSFHPLLVRGVASYSLEFLEAVDGLDTVYVPIGLGSGICGMIAARNALNRKTRIVGVVADRAPTYALSFEKGEPVPTTSSDTIADGVAVREPDEEALSAIRRDVERIVRVTEEEILEAISLYFSATHNVAEGAGAAALAALVRERHRQRARQVGVVLSGGNIDRSLYLRALRV